MSTPNFCYENRCIVVTDDDYEGGNTPELGEHIKDSNRSYPSAEVITDEEFKATKIILTAGYFEAGCLDYIQSEDDAIEATRYTESGSERSDEVNQRMADSLLESEAKKADRLLTRIKKAYGYEEVTCIGVASNGEGFYRRV